MAVRLRGVMVGLATLGSASAAAQSLSVCPDGTAVAGAPTSLILCDHSTIQAAVDAAVVDQVTTGLLVYGATYAEDVSIPIGLELTGLPSDAATTPSVSPGTVAFDVTCTDCSVTVRDIDVALRGPRSAFRVDAGGSLTVAGTDVSKSGSRQGVAGQLAWVNNDSTLRLEDVTATGLEGNTGSPLHVPTYATVQVIGGVYDGMSGVRGFLWFLEGGTGLVDGAVIRNVTATNEGGVLAGRNAHITVQNGAVLGPADAPAGPIYGGAAGSLTVIDSTFTTGTVDGSYGGLMFGSGTTVNISGSTFSSGAAPKGGLVYLLSGATLTATDSVFEGGAATPGGAFAIESSQADFTDCTFHSNTGSAIHARDSDVTLTRGTVRDNDPDANNTGGGGIEVFDSTLDVTGTQFLRNNGVAGGAILSASSVTTVDGALFQDNTAAQGGAIGAGVSLTSTGPNGSVSVLNSTFVGNQALGASQPQNFAAYGGAILASDLDAITIEGSLFDGNSAVSWGGALRMSPTPSTAIRGNVWCANSGDYGGAIHLDRRGDAQVFGTMIRDSVFFENVTSDGGGAVAVRDGLDLDLHQVTMVGNGTSGMPPAATFEGGHVRTDATSSATITNSILIDGTDGDTVWSVGTSGLAVTDSVVWNNLAPSGVDGDVLYTRIANADPGLAGMAPGTACTLLDWTPAGGGPAIDHGSTTVDGGNESDGSAPDAGATGGPTPRDPVVVADLDSDGDGDPDATDCAPFDNSVHNGAAEQCDGFDNNCTGTIDEGFPNSDTDSVADCLDNCDSTHNPSQNDADGDGVGDACDIEVQCDGLDDDGDGAVDEDFADDDGDTVANCVDVCVDVSDPGQADTDGDGVGDACDIEVQCDGLDDDGDGAVDEDFADDDGDTVANCVDVCVDVSDP
ncbi:MAG: right-handed parallel beta-helix repeat-containing protein, partial [Proteobacteria bacterium]|nr:right-handed parallel beta-helix repeat-containing protein [Pseudomonadota bacterium]